MYTFFLERYPHGIFAAGALVPTQEKKHFPWKAIIVKHQYNKP